MSEERKRILKMLAEGKIDVDQAERLLSAVGEPEGIQLSEEKREEAKEGTQTKPKYLHVIINSAGREGRKADQVKIRVPLKLLRTGMKLKGMLPQDAIERISGRLKDKGFDFDLGEMNNESFDEIMAALSELNIDINDLDEQIRIYCE